MEDFETNVYLTDPEYLECVADILSHPVFLSLIHI